MSISRRSAGEMKAMKSKSKGVFVVATLLAATMIGATIVVMVGERAGTSASSASNGQTPAVNTPVSGSGSSALEASVCGAHGPANDVAALLPSHAVVMTTYYDTADLVAGLDPTQYVCFIRSDSGSSTWVTTPPILGMGVNALEPSVHVGVGNVRVT